MEPVEDVAQLQLICKCEADPFEIRNYWTDDFSSSGGASPPYLISYEVGDAVVSSIKASLYDEYLLPETIVSKGSNLRPRTPYQPASDDIQIEGAVFTLFRGTIVAAFNPYTLYALRCHSW